MQAADPPSELIDQFWQDGVVKIPQIITSEEAAGYRQATMRILEEMPVPKNGNYGRAFHQRVNVWREDEKMRKLTLHSNLTATATKIAGTPLRLWHDHILAKMPGLPVPTAFHQDLVKWPYDRRITALSAWIALQDTTVEMGCMSFLPKSHYLLEVADIATSDQEGWRREQPDIEWSSRITIPLQAGDCTFHHGMTFHTAGPNQSDQWRVAHVVIFIEAQATYNGQRHIVTDPLDLSVGVSPPNDICPPV